MPGHVLSIWDRIEQCSRQTRVLPLLSFFFVFFFSEERETINQIKNTRISDCDMCHEEKKTGCCDRG